MQIKRTKIISGYGDVQRIADHLKEAEGITTTDASIRNALRFSTTGELPDKIRKVAVEVFHLPLKEEEIEI